MNSYVMYLTNSEYGKIARGVSQRSVLGPLLFPLYIDDIGNSLPNTPIKLFADYTNLFNNNTVEDLQADAMDKIVRVSNPVFTEIEKPGNPEFFQNRKTGFWLLVNPVFRF